MYYSIRDTSGREIRREKVPQILIDYKKVERQLAERNAALMEIMNGPNPLTPEELDRLLHKPCL